jgi:prolyl-tRNA synthetase
LERVLSKEENYVKHITKKSRDFSKWYTEIIRKAELADYAPVKGMIVIRPYGYSIWENLKSLLDKRIKETGHENAYFPMLIPESALQKETEHLEGFTPEVAWVTIGGTEELEERLAVRPTSEAIIGSMYSKWIKSYRDLPVMINQWVNIVRWEKATKPFIRTTEFLWQEGHTVHETQEEAQEETLKILDMYKEFVETELAVPVISGMKTDREKFAGAAATYAIEGLMSDGKSLQMGTSHDLGQHFSRVFNIRFEDREQKLQYAWQTSWGVSTRLVGALIMSHGDDSGLRLPPKVAPIQVVIVPISIGNWKEDVLPVAQKIEKDLREAGIRVKLDAREEFTPGWKFSDWEMRGVPLRLEIGPRDVKEDQVVVVRRDTMTKANLSVPLLASKVPELLGQIQKSLFNQAQAFQKNCTHNVQSYNEFKSILDSSRGFIKAHWCGANSCEEKIKEETKATIRILPLDEKIKEEACIYCGKKSKILAYFALSY